MRLGVSTWRRGTDVDLPTRVKSSANYVVARLARIEAHRLGYDDAILLNREGRVAEATGACVVALVDDQVVVPPSSEGALDSLTVRILEHICARDGVPFVRRPIDRTEALSAQEVGIAGTISELTLVEEIDGFAFPTDGGWPACGPPTCASCAGRPPCTGPRWSRCRSSAGRPRSRPCEARPRRARWPQSRAMCADVKRASTSLRPASPISAARSGSESNWPIASAMAAGSSGGTSSPVRPWST